MTAIAAPALYDVEVGHIRYQAMRRRFTHRTYLWLVDLDELPSYGPLGRFEARDHLGRPDRTIRANLEAYLATQGVDLHGGRIVMLANARAFGYVFNPLSVYWCHRPDGELECVVAEVHNTYGERHAYLLRTDDRGRAATEKDFYVSPFLTVDGTYTMSLPAPAERVSVSIALQQDGKPALVATVAGDRLPLTRRTLARLALKVPFVTQRTSALIRRHGVALWLRRLPIITRPVPEKQEEVQ